MKNLPTVLNTLFFKHFKLPGTARLEKARANFSPAENLVFGIIAGCFILFSVYLLYTASMALSTPVPGYGGALREGIVGTPRFVNPILAQSDTDRDVAELLFAGLLTHAGDGTLAPLLAKTWNVSSDGLTYTVILRDDVRFSDGIKVTTEDVLFTIESARDPIIKSNKRAGFEGVTIETPDAHTIIFRLKEAYAPFAENLTLGILPKHIWKNITREGFSLALANTEPIGAGPYALVSIEKDASGVPVSYTLAASDALPDQKAFISKIVLNFFSTEEAAKNALVKGTIDSLASIAPLDAEELSQKGYHIERATLPRIFGVFWNQNENPVLAHPEVRFALEQSIDRKEIVQKALHGFGVVAESPIPTIFRDGADTGTKSTTTATAILEKAGWKKNATGIYEKTTKTKTANLTESLTFSLSTANVPELVETANLLKKKWEENGMKVTLKVFELGDLNQNVIRPRKFDALLFGEIIGRDLDLYAFWHSSQRTDPGLNIALYANTKTDTYLKNARSTSDAQKRKEAFSLFEKEIQKDRPALFLYSPDFMYVVPKNIGGMELGRLTTSSERFLSVREWYTETENVWNIFADKIE